MLRRAQMTNPRKDASAEHFAILERYNLSMPVSEFNQICPITDFEGSIVLSAFMRQEVFAFIGDERYEKRKNMQ